MMDFWRRLVLFLYDSLKYTLRRLLITSRPLCICITEGLIIRLHYKPLMVYVYAYVFYLICINIVFKLLFI